MGVNSLHSLQRDTLTLQSVYAPLDIPVDSHCIQTTLILGSKLSKKTRLFYFQPFILKKKSYWLVKHIPRYPRLFSNETKHMELGALDKLPSVCASQPRVFCGDKPTPNPSGFKEQSVLAAQVHQRALLTGNTRGLGSFSTGTFAVISAGKVGCQASTAAQSFSLGAICHLCLPSPAASRHVAVPKVSGAGKYPSLCLKQKSSRTVATCTLPFEVPAQN